MLLRIACFTVVCCCSLSLHAQVSDPGQVAKDQSANHANNDMNNAADNGLNKAENSVKSLFKKKNKNAKTDTASKAATASTATASTATTGGAPGQDAASIKSYANYDFVPGDTVVFFDDFADDQDGEFAAHWGLEKGQAVINKVAGYPAFCLTEGNYAQVYPRMQKKTGYLPQNFTVEFDFYPTDGSSDPLIYFTDADEGHQLISFGKTVSTGYFEPELHGDYPGDEEHFNGQWHHAAMIKKGDQIKCYLDQYRVLVIPACENCAMVAVEMAGIGGTDHPIVFRNFRLASGGSMNMIGKKFTESKIVTHGITFDVDKSTLKPESMGTLNMIVNVMKNNPDVKFEIDGHTDNTGTSAHNVTLSQARADAVRTQLVSMGIDASRLSTKGFGDTKPISDNGTPAGQANNRRVEFVKM